MSDQQQNRNRRGGNQRRGRNSRNRRGRQNRQGRQQRTAPLKSYIPQVESPDCVLCGKPIKYVFTAIETPDTHEPAHFDCVLKDLQQKEKPGPKEKIVYLGNGKFGVVTFRTGGSSPRFTVKRMIDFENQKEKADWRRDLKIRVK